MNFELSENQIAFRDLARDYMKNPKVLRWIEEAEKTKQFPHAFMKDVAKLGFLGMNVGTQYGGCGMSFLDALIAFEEFAYASISFSLNILVQNSLASFAIDEFGTESQKAKYLPEMASGELLGCFANTEPDTGADAKNIITKATQAGNKFVLSGKKRFITSASESGVAVVFARTAKREPGSPGVTAFVIDIGPNAAGFTLDKKEDKNAQHGSVLCEFTLENYEAGKENILGSVGQGWDVCDHVFKHSRLWIAMQGVGAARRALDETMRYTALRKTFGKPILENQAVGFKLAEIKIEIEAARLLIYKAVCQEMDKDPEFGVTASMAKYAGGEIAQKAATWCYRYFGGMSIAKDSISSKLLMDSLIIPIYEGPSEIQLMMIWKHIQKLAKSL